MSIKVSIIVPVYNTAPYLQACIDSIISQSFNDFELLLVDDGSTDESGVICDSNANRDRRIRVFHKKNGGVSSARNLGLDNALGEWVYFVDSDDELLPNGLQVLIDGTSNLVDLVLGGYEQYDQGGNILHYVSDRVSMILSRKEALLALFPNHSLYYSYLGYMWLYMFRNKMIQDNHLRFDTSIKIKEDTLFLSQYLCCINGNVFFSTAPVYKYKVREDSAMGSLGVRFSPAYLTSMDAVIQIHSLIQKFPDADKELVCAAKNEVVNRVYLIYGQMIKHNAVDKSLLSSLKKRAIREIGVPFYFSYQWHRNYRRIKNKINRIFKS